MQRLLEIDIAEVGHLILGCRSCSAQLHVPADYNRSVATYCPVCGESLTGVEIENYLLQLRKVIRELKREGRSFRVALTIADPDRDSPSEPVARPGELDHQT